MFNAEKLLGVSNNVEGDKKFGYLSPKFWNIQKDKRVYSVTQKCHLWSLKSPAPNASLISVHVRPVSKLAALRRFPNTGGSAFVPLHY